ncbi:MAG: AAA domain-containing protein [Thermoflexibacter sp.]
MQELQDLLNILKIEQEEDFRNYQQYILQTPLNERRKQGFCWYPVKLNYSEIGTGELVYISVERTAFLGEPHAFSVGSMVSFFVNTEEKNAQNNSVSGVISAIWKDTMKIALHTDELPDWVEDGKLGIDILFDNVSYREMENALKQVIKAEKGRIVQLREILLGEKIANFKPLKYEITLTQLNDSQNQAVRNVLSAQEVAIIHGPPGTGKTTTLVQAIRLALKNKENALSLLVAAPSNAAVDLLTEKLASEGIKVLRIGNPARVDEDIQQYTLDNQISNHPLFKDLKKYRRDAENFRQMAGKYKRNFGADEREQRKLLYAEAKKLLKEASELEKYISKDILDKAEVITATLVGTANQVLQERRFDTVFIDEAAQALEPATWIPILKAEKVVFAGDHWQLPPTVKSMEADRKGLSKTLFEKCILRHKKLDNPVDVMLRTQYRMNEAIMQFPNEQFYENQLIASEKVRHWVVGENIAPVEFIDTAGCGFEETPNPETGSTANPEEAKLLFRHLKVLIQEIDSQSVKGIISIGLISPYKAQTHLLKEELEYFKQEYPKKFILEKQEKNHVFNQLNLDIEVNTVDSFQGQERDIIYISLVRSNSEGEIGFLKDTRRMNVAMTRARKKLVVIGDSAILANFKFYNDFLNYIDRIHAYRSAWEWSE